MALSNFGVRKNKSFESWFFRFNIPHPTQEKVKFTTPRAQSIVKCPGFARGRAIYAIKMAGLL